METVLYGTVKIDLSRGLPERYIINKDATILFWEDGTKTIVKKSEDDKEDIVKSFLWAYFQKQSGLSKTQANKYLKKISEQYDTEVNGDEHIVDTSKEFKVGDRVRAIENGVEYEKGDVLIIEKIRDDGYHYCKKLNGDKVVCTESRLEKVSE